MSSKLQQNRRLTVRCILFAALLTTATVTPLAIIQAATKKDPPAADKASEEAPTTQPAQRSADRVKKLKANLATFHLELGQVLKMDWGCPGVTWILTAKPLPEQLPPPGEFSITWSSPGTGRGVPHPVLTMRISEKLAGEIIDHLAKNGFFARAKPAKGDLTLKPSTVLLAGTSGHDYLCYEVLDEARAKTLSDYVRRAYDKAVAVRNAKLTTARDALVRKAISLKPGKGRIDRKSDQNPTGLDFSDVLKWSGQKSFVERFAKAPKPYDEKINELRIDSGSDSGDMRVWALCALLDHPNFDVKIRAARALGASRYLLADAVPALLAASKSNDHMITGSENATLHGIYRGSLKKAMEKITGLNLSKADTGDFRGQLDFGKVENWLRDVFLSWEPGRTRELVGRGPGKKCYLDLDTGKVYADPKGLLDEKARRRWCVKTGIDLICEKSTMHEPGPSFAFVGVDLQTAEGGYRRDGVSERWFDLRASHARTRLAKVAPSGRAVPFSTAFVFKTRAGRVGQLQFIQATDDRLTFRYRLVGNKKPTTQPAADDAAAPNVKFALACRAMSVEELVDKIVRKPAFSPGDHMFVRPWFKQKFDKLTPEAKRKIIRLFAEEVAKIQEGKQWKILGTLHARHHLIQYLTDMRARDELVKILGRRQGFDCCAAPAIIDGIAVCGRREDAWLLVRKFQTMGHDGGIECLHKALVKLTGLSIAKPSSQTKDTYAKLWTERLVRAKTPTTQPAKKPAGGVGKISRVKSLVELRALKPVRKAKDWEVRVGWADSGIENAPWKLLYVHCLYTGKQEARDRKAMESWGYYRRLRVLGPVGWDMHYASPGRRAVKPIVHVNHSPRSQLIRHSTERVYCTVVATPLAGTYEITVGGKEPVIATITVKKTPELSWMPLLVHPPIAAKGKDARLTMSRILMPAAPAHVQEPVFLHGRAPRARDEQKLFAKSLPGQSPGLAGWRLYEEDAPVVGILARMTPLRLSAEIAAGKLLLHCKGFVPQQPERQFLAQWRINGKLVTANLSGKATRDRPAGELEAARLSKITDKEESTVEIPLVLPPWLVRHAKAGDKISVSVLFSPAEVRRIVRPPDSTALYERSRAMKECNQPVMSKPIIFTVTKAMLADAHAAAGAVKKLKAVPATTKPAAIQPAKKSAGVAGKIPRVKSLVELRALKPARKAKDWEVRVGWADSGIENAPWKLLYVHYLYTGDKKVRDRKAMEPWGYHHRNHPLGPVGWDMRYAPPGRRIIKHMGVLVNRSMQQELLGLPNERMYCAVVPTPLAGSYEVRVGGKAPAVANILVKKAPELSWTPLLAPQAGGGGPERVPPAMSGWFRAVVPAYRRDPIFFHSGKPRAKGERKLFAKALPGRFPGIAGWRLYEDHGEMAGILERMTPLRIKAEISGGKLLLGCKGFTPYRPARQFLAQWRVNGKLVVAPRLGKEQKPQGETIERMREAELKMINTPEEFTVKIPLVLPAWLTGRVKAGDKVSLAVLYSAGSWREIVHPSNMTIGPAGLSQTLACTQPVMSNPVAFTVTKAMLTAARTAAETAKASENPGRSNGIFFSIQADAKSVSLGEPVMLSFVAKNVSKQKIVLPIDWGFQCFSVEVVCGGETYKKGNPFTHPGSPLGLRAVTLAPGEAYTQRIDMLRLLRLVSPKRTGQKVGKCSIRAALNSSGRYPRRYGKPVDYRDCWKGSARAEVEIEVLAPKNDADAAALKVLRSGGSGAPEITDDLWSAWGEVTGGEDKRFSTILRKHPGSPLAPWCHLALARAYARVAQFLQYRLKRDEFLAKSLEHSKAILTDYPKSRAARPVGADRLLIDKARAAMRSFRVEILEKGYRLAGRRFDNAAKLVGEMKKIAGRRETPAAKIPVRISMAPKIKWGRVVNVFNLLTAAGFKKVDLDADANAKLLD